MSSKSLYSQLNKSLRYCSIVGQKFLPQDVLHELITEENIKKELRKGLRSRLTSSKLPRKIASNSRRLFAVLVLIGEQGAIKQLLKHGMTDDDLPFTSAASFGNESVLKSTKGNTVNSFLEWKNEAKVAAFLTHQWLVLAPVLDVTGASAVVKPECPLPFLEGDEVRGDHNSTVYRSVLPASHQKGIRHGQKSDRTVAVKQFKNADHFSKERKILEAIRSIDDTHVIQHLLCCERVPLYFIVFPWADGGNLGDFWECHTSSPKLIFWSFQQMLGITNALSELHNINCRHGDLKPANILHFKQGKSESLVIADVGVSKIHGQVTDLRHGPTLTKATTVSYEPPEVYLDLESHEPRPRSRQYDIWSLACIFLEHVVWMLYGADAVAGFANARDEPGSKFFKLQYGSDGTTAVIHPSVQKAVEVLRRDPRSRGDTALTALINIITKHLLRVSAGDRDKASELSQKLRQIVQRAAQDHSYLLHSIDYTPDIPSIFKRPARGSNMMNTSMSVS